MDAFLLLKIFDNRRVASGEWLEALFPAGIRQAATVEDEASAVARFVARQIAVKRETENADDEIVGIGGERL